MITIDTLSHEDIDEIFSQTKEYLHLIDNRNQKADILKGKTILLAFFENSTRTKLSFEIAAKRLSAEL